jgi:alanine-synthesizing transaminase
VTSHRKSAKLANVAYDIRGPVLDKARRMQEAGESIIQLNIGNVAAFGLQPPEAMLTAMLARIPQQAGYTDSKGLVAPREAVAQYAATKGIAGVTPDDVYLGNGVSELIQVAINALLNDGDEVLIPTPDYPLYTALVGLAGGVPVHYRCDEAAGWLPDLEDIRDKVGPRTRAIFVCNPNNPTGALYPEPILRDLLEVARAHRLVVLADEIYDQTLYDGHVHTSVASLADDVLVLTFNGLSKNYRACGFRAGWMIVSGDCDSARDYIEGLTMLASLRLCSNTPGQIAIQAALAGDCSIAPLVAPGGRLQRQRDLAHALLSEIPGVSAVKPKAALYLFPRLDPAIYRIADDQQFAYDLLAEERLLIVQGTGFNWIANDHFRLVFLPEEPVLREAIGRLASFLGRRRDRPSPA